MEVTNHEGHGRTWKGAGMDEREGEVRKEGGMWGDGEGEGERAREEGKKLSVDVHANCTGVDSLRRWNNERAKYGRVHVNKSYDICEDIGLYVPELVREMSIGPEVQVGCDGVRRGHGSGSSIGCEDLEGRGNRWRQLVVRATCIQLMRSLAEMTKLRTHLDGRNVEEEEDEEEER